MLTAWSAAGIAGPLVLNKLREYELAQGVAKTDAYAVTMYIMAGLLVIGFICNWLVTPVAQRYFVKPGAAEAATA